MSRRAAAVAAAEQLREVFAAAVLGYVAAWRAELANRLARAGRQAGAGERGLGLTG